MPKIVDNFILQQKIGSGQFGDVYKGINQITNTEVAIKTIRRQTIKGKFYELLQNQITVLKTCDNPYIMKLYAIKKTANHYYLMLEYCNEGDMLQKVKKYKIIQQNQVVKYFCQILTGFQTLVKHKIMHRDFKLANILLHDGNIKIADFGFSKLLNSDDYATTMLGSPLNMAPEVLGGNKYNNKADIWSIGACVYQMLYGKPPYIASNMVDLLKNIKSKPLTFPTQIKVNDVLKDVLSKMLVADPKKRISWSDLFTHPINRYLDSLVRKQIDLELMEDQSLMMNTSKYYLKKNLVISKPSDIQDNAKMNEQLVQIIRSGQKSQIKQLPEQEAEPTPKQQIKKKSINQKNSQLLQKNHSLIFRKNSKILLHFRNIYAFLATVVDQTTQLGQDYCDETSYVLILKIINTIDWLIALLNANKKPSLKGIQKWQEYKQQKQFSQVKQYISREKDVFQVFKTTLQSTIKQKSIKGNISGNAKSLLMENFDQQIYKSQLMKYIKSFTKKTVSRTLLLKDFSQLRHQWKHILQLLICLQSDKIFGQGEFDFNKFYQQFEEVNPQETLCKVQMLLVEAF